MLVRALSPLAMISAIAVVAGQACAQVIEIGPEGLTTISGPAVFTPDGSSPLRGKTAPAMSPASAKRLNEISPLIDAAGLKTALSPRLIEAVAYVESRFRLEAISSAGAGGVMQLMPDTARDLGVSVSDPADNIRGGAIYLGRMLDMFDGDLELALAAYNAGPGAVQRHGGAPPFVETQAYVAAVLEYLAKTSLQDSD